MPKQTLHNLMTQLHDVFGSADTSPEQQKLFEELNGHIHEINENDPVDPTPLETVELLLEQLGEDHPKTSALLNEMLNTLRRIS